MAVDLYSGPPILERTLPELSPFFGSSNDITMKVLSIGAIITFMLSLVVLPKTDSLRDGTGESVEEWYSASATSVIVHISHFSNKSNKPGEKALKAIGFCRDCPDPQSEGSIASGLLNYHNLFPEKARLEFDVTSELVWAIPNYADHKKLLNAEQMQNRIVLVRRGRNSLYDKVHKIMTRTEAVAVIIVDDGQCNETFQWCGPRAGNVQTQGFSSYDQEETWEDLHIPVLMITATTGERFNRMMTVKSIDVLGFSEPQLMTVLQRDIKLRGASGQQERGSQDVGSFREAARKGVAEDEYGYYDDYGDEYGEYDEL